MPIIPITDTCKQQKTNTITRLNNGVLLVQGLYTCRIVLTIILHTS